MRKLQRQIKRAFLDQIKPGNKPKDTGMGMRTLNQHAGFKQWREELKKTAKAWRKMHGYV